MGRPKRAGEANGLDHALNRENPRATIFPKPEDPKPEDPKPEDYGQCRHLLPVRRRSGPFERLAAVSRAVPLTVRP
jgi:hypothetical protein